MDKICNKCDKLLDFENFHKNKNYPDGYMNTCKDCRSAGRKTKPRYEVSVEKRICGGCKVEKPSDEFYKDKSSKSGIQTYCKTCSHERMLQYYKNGGIDLFLRCLVKDAKTNAKRRRGPNDSIHFNLTFEDVKALYYTQEGKCALSGQLMTHISYTTNDKRNKNVNNISLDRIDSSKGYTPDNIQLVCVICNYMKWDMPMENFLNMCKLIVDKHT